MNSYLLKDEYDCYKFQLSYPSVDDIGNHIGNSNDNLLLHKLDISRAFRNLCIDPLGDLIRHEKAKQNLTVYLYIDDIIGI